MNPYLEALDPLEHAKKGARRVIDGDLAALPVVGDEGQLIGALTVDAATAQVAPAGWREQMPKVFS